MKNITYSDFIKTFGYIIAPLLKGTCEWFMNNAKHPIKLSMRSSEPFSKVSKMLIELKPTKYEKLNEWEDIFINRDLSKLLNEPNISLYCRKSGLCNKYTMCDIGYSDKIYKNLLGSEFAPSEFLQMFSANGNNYFDQYIRNSYNNNFDFYIDLILDDNKIHAKFDEFFSHYIMHFLPKTHKKYNDAACAEFDSDGNSILLDNKNPFVEPFYKGVYLSLKNNKITEKETLDFLCNSDLAKIQRLVLMTHNNYAESPWPFFEPDNLIIRGTDLDSQTFDAVLAYKKQMI